MDAASAEGNLSIDWQAPADCPGERELRGSVENLLGAAPEAALASSMRVSARVRSASASAYRLTLRIESAAESGERSLDAASCAPLAEAAALLVAMAIDPRVAARPALSATIVSPAPPASAAPLVSPAASGSAPSSAPKAAPRPRPRRAPLPIAESDAAVETRELGASPSATRDLRNTLGVAGAITLGDLPNPALGVRARWAQALGPYRLALGLGYFGNQRVERAANPSPDERWGVSLWLFELDTQGCYEQDLAGFALGPCAGIGLRGFRARGLGADRVNSSFVVVPEAVLGGVGRYSLTRELGVFLNVGARFVPVAPSFVVERRGEVFQPATIGASFDLGIEVFPTKG
jgi:hypothetical protein